MGQAVDKGKTDYRKYRLSWQQKVMSILVGSAGTVSMVMIFYRSVWMMIAACILGGVAAPQIYKKQLIQKRQKQLQMEFKDALYSLIVALRAGRSMEGAFISALEDMDSTMTPYIYQEWKSIAEQLQVGFPVEDCLEDFGVRSGIEEIRSFARTIEVCKRTEGDLARVMENTIHLLQERMEIQMELKVLLTRKKTEQKILNIMPFLVIGLLLLMSPDYLEPLYNCLQGQIIMTICVGITLFSYFLSRKMANIML